MTWHITARMAWHDRGWDGRVCDDPAGNSFCSGSHSLLSDRIAREKSVECESPCTALDKSLPDYLPPCFWSSSAFAATSTEILHRHPFSRYRDKKQIKDELPPYAIYTWPFRLSMTHASFKRNGSYFPDLTPRIERYVGRLRPSRSLIFYYLNYDNPVSADDYKYALVGCARLADVSNSGEFSFDDGEFDEIRSGRGMKNFPRMNWALKLSHKGPYEAIVLPYHAYLKHIAEHPEDEDKLAEIRVLIDETALIPGFKYVSEQIHNDHALVLLYKLKRALDRIQEHGIVDVDRELGLVDRLLEDCWSARGLYPGLGAVVKVLADLSEGEIQPQGEGESALIEVLRATLGPSEDLADALFSLLESRQALPTALAAHKRVLTQARLGYRDQSALISLLRKLSLFALTPRQIGRILFPDSDGGPAFGSLKISHNDIKDNPYLLAEAYVPATNKQDEEKADLDREQRSDGAIDYATIDVGMFPDTKYLDRHDDLHDLTVAGPQRLRAFALQALRTAESEGHSFSSSARLAEHATRHPLFWRQKLVVNETQLLSDAHLAHYRERLHVAVVDGAHFFYRRETWNAEQVIKRFVTHRLALPPLKVNTGWLEPYLASEAEELGTRIREFDKAGFVAERTRLMSGALGKGFYCATGRPGAGKSQAVAKLLAEFAKLGERTVVLAPTGKAALRLNKDRPTGATWEAQTIDRWIWTSGLGGYTDDWADLGGMARVEKFEPFDNLVIDETSMVDLFQLGLIFRAIEVHQPTTTKRVILVGDENQLPPIGCGKPFQDILAFIRADSTFDVDNHVRLIANCRQKHDTTVLDAAHLFAGGNRYHSELFDQLCIGGDISEHLSVRYFTSMSELHDEIGNFVNTVLDEAVPSHKAIPADQAFNLLLKLFDSGSVPGFNAAGLALDRVQLLSPYRGGPTGALGLSEYVRDVWRGNPGANQRHQSKGFMHADKIVRISNLYAWNSTTEARELRLSNGSIGVLSKTQKRGWQGFFPESKYSIDWDTLDPEHFELAYALTVHKAQGSEFEEVLMVVPERRALLSRELLYTAMTRSKGHLTLLVEKSERANALQVARDRSVLLQRNSSIFSDPFDAARLFEPEAGVKVRSKVEYIIYTHLKQARDAGKLTFTHETPLDLPFDTRVVSVRPDFTIQSAGKTYYWEHLGMLDRQDYARDWRARRRAYETAGHLESLLTSDDLAGIGGDRIHGVIDDLVSGRLGGRADFGFSRHHYQL